METTLISPDMISPDAVREWLFHAGWTYHKLPGLFTKYPSLDHAGPECRVPEQALPSHDSKFDWIAQNTETPRDTLIEDLLERTQRLLEGFLKRPNNSEKLFDPEVLWTEEPVRHVPDSHVQTVVSALRNGIEYARNALKELPAKALSSSRLEKHVTSLMEADIREMERALELLGVKE